MFVSHHQQSRRFAWWSHVPKSYDGYFQKKMLKSGGYVRMTPFPGCQWPQGSYRRGKVIFPFAWWMDSKKNLQKKTSCGLGFRHCIVTRICMPTLGFVGIGGSMPAWPSNPASQKPAGTPAWPTQFVTSRYKVKVSHARSPKRPQLGSSTATRFHGQEILKEHIIHTSGQEGIQHFEPQTTPIFCQECYLDLCRAGTTTPSLSWNVPKPSKSQLSSEPLPKKVEGNLANTHEFEELSTCWGAPQSAN